MARFNPSYRGLGELLVSPEMEGAMHRKAEELADAARAISPVGPVTTDEREHYIDSFKVSSGVQQEPSRRAYGEVLNDSEHAAAVEFGNGRTAPKTIGAHFVLTRALDMLRE